MILRKLLPLLHRQHPTKAKSLLQKRFLYRTVKLQRLCNGNLGHLAPDDPESGSAEHIDNSPGFRAGKPPVIRLDNDKGTLDFFGIVIGHVLYDVRLFRHKLGEHAKVLAEARTDAFGVAGLPLPADADPAKLVVSVQSDRFNARHLRVDGRNVVENPRKRLYGD